MDDDGAQHSFEGDMDEMAAHDMADLFDDPEPPVHSEASYNSPTDGQGYGNKSFAKYTEVPERIDDLSVNGCCQKLAWSKTGSIAHICRSGQSVDIHHFSRTPGTTEFTLSRALSLLSPNSRFQFPLTNLTWSPSGNELAVFDSVGGVAIYTTWIAINRMKPALVYASDGSEFEAAVVGVQWLRPDRTSALCHSATREANHWRYHVSSTNRSNEPMHPLSSKSAFICVTRNGTLRLFYGNLADPYWSHVSSRTIPSDMGDCETLITHASFAHGRNESLWLVTHSMSRTLSLYEVKIDWHYKGKPNQPPPPGLKLMPTLSVVFLKAEPNLGVNNSNEESYFSATLTHLRLLPQSLDYSTSKQLNPSVFALYSITTTSPDASFATQSRSTRLVQIVIDQSSRNLHPDFEKLRPTVTKASSLVITFTRSPDISVLGTVVSLEPQRNNTSLGLVKTDGIVEVFDRATLQAFAPQNDPKALFSTVDAGYAFQAIEQHVHRSLSPNGVLLVYRGQDEDLHLHSISRSQNESGEFGEPNDVAIIGQAVLFYTSLLSYSCNDDLLSLLQQEDRAQLSGQESIENLYKALNVNVDYTLDDNNSTKAQKLLINPGVLRCLAYQQTLNSRPGSRRNAATVASLVLELRTVSLASGIAINDINAPGDQTDPTASLLSLARWFTDLVAYLVDDVLDMKRSFAGKEVTSEDLQDQTTHNQSPTLLLLLSSLPRSFLRVTSRYIRTLGTPQTPAKPFQPPLTAHLASSPVDIRHFETFLDGLNHYCREAYDTTDSSAAPTTTSEAADGTAPAEMSSEARRASLERKFLISGEVPSALLPVINNRLLGSSIDKLVAEGKVDPLRLFEMDFSSLDTSLGVDSSSSSSSSSSSPPSPSPADPHPKPNPKPDQNTASPRQDPQQQSPPQQQPQQQQRPPKFDIVRKVALPPTLKRWRRCTRCEGAMEDFGTAKGVPFWIVKLGRTCVCGNLWVLVEGAL